MKIRRKQPGLLKVITDEEVEMIHEASLRILSEVGVKYPNSEILAIFDGAGATVDYKTQIVKIPASLVDKMLQGSKKDFLTVKSDSGPPLILGDGDLKLSMDATPIIVDVKNGTCRTGTREDIMRGIAVSNALPNVRLAAGYCNPSDIHPEAADVLSHELLFTYSKKAVSSWIYSLRSAEYILEMAKIVAGGDKALREKKLFTYFAEPLSPLTYAKHTLEVVLLLSAHGIPINFGPMVTMGGTGPATIAGSLAMHNAEMLQGLTLLYLCNPDQPLIYSMHAHSLDMATMYTQYGAPEQALLAVGATQLAKKYGFAVAGNVMLSDSNTLDYMAGFEEAATTSFALAAGWDMLGFVGYGTIGVVGNGVGHSLEKVIIQDEALSYMKRILSSFDVNEETLGVDLIKDVGPGGFFSSEEHTVRHMKEEIWRGNGIFKNITYTVWENEGRKTVTDRAHERLLAILEDATPMKPVLSESMADSLAYITAQAVKECESKKKGE